MRKYILIIAILLVSSFSVFSNNAKGPLLGKNYYVLFLPYYSFPGFSAAPGEKHDFSVSIAQYFVQDIVTEFHAQGNYFIKERFIDYEGYILEGTFSYNIFDSLEVGITSRMHAYYGGWGDSVIEWFHGIFNFPNGGREYFGKDEVHINIQTDTGINYNLTEPAVGFGDLDLYLKWNFLSFPFMDMAAMTAFKFPTGSVEKVTGSGYMDFAASLLMDFHPLKWLSIYLQNGFILPGQLFVQDTPSPNVIYSGLLAVEFIPVPCFSIIAQFRLNNSPVAEGSVDPENPAMTYAVKLDPAMTNLLLGIVFTVSDFRFQFDFEEDAFTNNGADIIFNITVSKRFHLGRKKDS